MNYKDIISSIIVHIHKMKNLDKTFKLVDISFVFIIQSKKTVANLLDFVLRL